MTPSSRSMEPARDITRLVEIMHALRNPEGGCPWDIEQSFASIAPHTIEEAYEVADAIERGDLLDLRDELGDLLLQVVYHAQIASEQSAFDLGDVVFAITRKMIRRHPHVFGDVQGATSAEAIASWARIKNEEKAERAAERSAAAKKDDHSAGIGETVVARDHAPPPSPTSILADIPSALPALTRAVKLQNKAATVGFDWPSLRPVFDKMREELAELEDALKPSENEPLPDQNSIEDEFGDLLFVMANVARHLKLDPEAALRRANAKFTRRFASIEAKLAARGKVPSDSDLAEMDALWDAAKREERE